MSLRSCCAVLVGLAIAIQGGAASGEQRLLLATTTSVHDSGLLDALLPRFASETGIQVRTIAVGTGAALRMGAEGNADVLITHAPERETALLDTGEISERWPFMENYFLIAGPQADPAKFSGAGSLPEAWRRLAENQATYVSRADDSGTHLREQALLQAAGIDPAKGWPGLLKTGAGMGASLQVAGERRAYILSDLGTFLAFRKRIGLRRLSKPAPELRNVYSVLAVNPERFPKVHREGTQALIRFLTAPDTQKIIAGFGQERFGQPLFQPLAAPSSR